MMSCFSSSIRLFIGCQLLFKKVFQVAIQMPRGTP